MNYFLIAGEASGDLHAANLMRELKREDPAAAFCFLGGDLMAAEGGTLVRHYREMAFMGFVEVARHLGKILENFRICREAMARFAPDAVILVDYPGFNLKMARFAKERLGVPVYYYISPKIWAWKEYRIKRIKRYVDRLYCILPFEVDFYRRHDYPVDYVGNPTVDELAARPCADESFAGFTQENRLSGKPIIALLAGSRRHEIASNLPTMLRAAAAYPDYQPVVAGAPGLDPACYAAVMGETPVPVVFGKTYRLLQQASAAAVTSGTATLETALLDVPQVVCYQIAGGRLTHAFFSRLLKVPYISLVNLIADKPVVQELAAHLFTEKNVRETLGRLLTDPLLRERMRADYARIRARLGKPGAPARTARSIVESLRGSR